MDFFVGSFLLWILNIFTAESSRNTENEDLVGFFFGTSPWEKEDKSDPINDDYDKGPDW